MNRLGDVDLETGENIEDVSLDNTIAPEEVETNEVEEVVENTEVQPEVEVQETEGGGFQVQYEDDNGELVTEVIDEKALSKIWKDYRKNGQKYESFKSIEPFISEVRNSDFLQYYITYKAQGFTEQQIYDAYYMQMHPELSQRMNTQPSVEEEEPEYFDSTEAEIKYRTEKIVKQAVAPLQDTIKDLNSKLQSLEMEKTQSATINYNNVVLGSALQELGKNPNNLNEEELKTLGATITTLYPNVDLRVSKLNEQQAKLLAKAAFGGNTKLNEQTKRSNNGQAVKTPIAIQGSSKGTRGTSEMLDVEASTRSERIKRIDELLN